MNLSENLKFLRLKRNLSQNKLAEILQISRSKVNAYETGISEPGLNTLVKISNFYQIGLDELITKKASSDSSEDAFEKDLSLSLKKTNSFLKDIVIGYESFYKLRLQDSGKGPDSLENELIQIINDTIENNESLINHQLNNSTKS